jgi:carboxymethylenebutenolidase
MASSDIVLKTIDGHTLGAYKAEPAGTPKGAIVVVQEIFGVNDHIRAVADGFAAAGYVAIAPALYDRVQPNVQLGYAPDDAKLGMEYRAKITREQTFADLVASIEAVKDVGKVGMVGYCWGGLMTWLSAAHIGGLSACVGYYAGGIGQNIDAQPKCPIMMNFGEKDHAIPLSDVEALKQAHPEVPVYTYDAGHGFNCDQRPSYDEPSAKLALERTLAFFGKHLG